MKKINYSQLELFKTLDSHSRTKVNTQNLLLKYIHNYEKIILIITGFIIVGAISFCLGVEKGKNLAMLKTDSYLETQAKIQPPTYDLSTKEKVQPLIEKKDTVEQPKIKETIHNYTIQVASYQNKRYAEKEAERLRKKGLSPLILSKGKFSVLCVGNFSNREIAKSLLSKLKEHYRDCYIRRL